MEKSKVFNIGCFLDGEKIFATSFEEDFATKVESAENHTLFTVEHAQSVFDVAKREIFFVAGSALKSVNGILEHNLQILIPTQNVRLVKQILAVFSSFAKSLILNENDSTNNPLDVDAWRMSMPERKIH